MDGVSARARRVLATLSLLALPAAPLACARQSPAPSATQTTAAAVPLVTSPPATSPPTAVASPLPATTVAAPASSSSTPVHCVPGKASPSTLGDAQLFAEIKACGRQMPSPRGVALLREAQRRLQGKTLSRDDLVDRLGFPTAGEHLKNPSPVLHADELIQLTRGAFTEKTADAVLVWEAYQSPVLWEFWWAVKDGAVVGSGSYDVVRE